MRDKVAEELKAIMAKEKGRKNQISGLYDWICVSEQPGESLRVFLGEVWGDAYSQSRDSYFKGGEKRGWKRKYGDYFQATLDCLIEKNQEEADFYENAWNFLLASPVFDTVQDRHGAFEVFLSSPQIPYFQLEKGIKMDNESFKERYQNLQPQIQELNHIMKRRLTQRTEQASLINRVFNEVNSEEDKAVLMAYFIIMLGEKKED